MDKDYLSQKLDNGRLKCAQGSHFFNGSCYFISNKKSSASSLFDTSSDLSFINYLNKNTQIKRARFMSSSSSNHRLNDLMSPISNSVLPVENSWNSAVRSCLELSNDSSSSLIYFENGREYEFLVSLLTKLHFPNLLNLGNIDKNIGEPDRTFYNEEQKYYIGLTYNGKFGKILFLRFRDG